MMQSRLFSFLEAAANVGAGLVLSFLLQLVLFDALAIAASLGQNLILTGAFTVLSLIRSYALRRLFDGFLVRVHHPVMPRSRKTCR